MTKLGDAQKLFNIIRDDEGLLNSQDMFDIGFAANAIKDNDHELLAMCIRNQDSYMRDLIASAINPEAYHLVGLAKI